MRSKQREDSYRVVLQFRRPRRGLREQQTGEEEFLFDLFGTLEFQQVLAWPTDVGTDQPAMTRIFSRLGQTGEQFTGTATTAARSALSSLLENALARFLVELDVVVLPGILVAAASAYLLSTGYLWAGGLVLLASGMVDLSHFALDRELIRDSRLGEFLAPPVHWVYEKVGPLTRPERVAALGLGLIMGHWWPLATLASLGAIAASILLTSAQRWFSSAPHFDDER